MNNGNKILRTILSVLLVAAMLFSVYMGASFIYYITEIVSNESFGVSVAGVDVTKANKSDVLGDGKVSYNESKNTLTFNNAVIEYDYSIISTEIDLRVELIGENKFICKDNSYIIAIYAADYILAKDIYIGGEGSLTIEYQNVTNNAVGIFADDLVVESEITIDIPDCTDSLIGISCYSSLLMRETAKVTVNSGASKESGGISVRGNAIFEPGSDLNVSVAPGATDACRGVCVEGNLILAKDTTLSVSIDDEIAQYSECISVSGVLDIGANASVNASAKKTYGIECYTSVKINEGATVSATTAGECADIFCYGAVVNYGGSVNGQVEGLGGTHNYAED